MHRHQTFEGTIIVREINLYQIDKELKIITRLNLARVFNHG